MRAEQKPQLMKGRLVRVTKTATRCPQTGHGAVPSSGMAGLSSSGSFACCCAGSLFDCSETFRRFIQQLAEPFHAMALLCVCFGLRISECLALKWSDADWLNSRLRIERAIVRSAGHQILDTGSSSGTGESHRLLQLINVQHIGRYSALMTQKA